MSARCVWVKPPGGKMQRARAAGNPSGADLNTIGEVLGAFLKDLCHHCLAKDPAREGCPRCHGTGKEPAKGAA